MSVILSNRPHLGTCSHWGPVGFMRETSQEHKLEPLGQIIVIPGIAQDCPSGTRLENPHPAKRRRSQYVMDPGDTGVLWKTG